MASSIAEFGWGPVETGVRGPTNVIAKVHRSATGSEFSPDPSILLVFDLLVGITVRVYVLLVGPT